MVTALRVILDEVLDPGRLSAAHYAEELTRGLTETAPSGCEVVGFVSSSSPHDDDAIKARLPGLARLVTSKLSRSRMSDAWQYGFVRSLVGGMLHAPSLLAPLGGRSSRGGQTVVTIHDGVVWTDPATLEERSAAWSRTMVRRAERYADAVVVPSHSVAAVVAENTSLGDRIRVVPPGAARRAIPADADARAARMGLPERYLVSPASLNPRKALRELLMAIAPLNIPLIVTSNGDWREEQLTSALAELGIPDGRVRVMGHLPEPDRTVVDARAAAFVQPSWQEGFGISTLEAMALGIPAIISDDPALVELTDGAARVVSVSGDYVGGLRQAITEVLDDEALAERLAIAGRDRSKAFSWHDSAEKVWQLHADL